MLYGEHEKLRPLCGALTGAGPLAGTKGQGDGQDEVGDGGRVMIDIDDTIIEVHGYTKQGSGYGYSGVRGLNALLATLSTTQAAPVIVAQRLRRGSCGSPRGAKRLVADALRTAKQLPSTSNLRPLVRADSAFYGCEVVNAALRSGADVSVTVRLDKRVRAAIATIDQDAGTPIEYTDAVYDEQTSRWVSRAEVAEIAFTAFTSKKKADQVTGRLVVRRIPDLNEGKKNGQDTLFDTWRFHAFFTTTDPEAADTVAADKTHRAHAIIEQVHADLKGSALAHLPSASFNANAAWFVLAVMAFNLTRAAATLTGPGLAWRQPPRSVASSSPCPPGLRPQHAESPCTSQPDGPGKPPGRNCSVTAADHRPRSPDHPPSPTQPRNQWNALTLRPDDHPRPRPQEPPSTTPTTQTRDHRWIEAE